MALIFGIVIYLFYLYTLNCLIIISEFIYRNPTLRKHSFSRKVLWNLFMWGSIFIPYLYPAWIGFLIVFYKL